MKKRSAKAEGTILTFQIWLQMYRDTRLTDQQRALTKMQSLPLQILRYFQTLSLQRISQQAVSIGQ